MTETEKLLETALKELSKQYEYELTQLAKKLENVRQENNYIKQLYNETVQQNEIIEDKLEYLTVLLERWKEQ